MKILSTSCLVLIIQILSFAQTTFQVKIDSLFLDSLFESSIASVSIFDLTAEKPLFEKNEKQLFHPASNLKILTSAAGLYFLGPDYQFQTSVYHSGKIVDSTCYGDLFIVGGFDPNFTPDDLDTMVMRIKGHGIREIKGNIVGDITMFDSLFWGNGWMWDDDPSSDAPYLSPLNINSNCVDIMLEPGELGTPAKVTVYPESQFYTIKNYSSTYSTDTSWIKVNRDWINRTNDFFISGGISSSEIAIYEKINIYNPALFFLSLLKERLKNSNILFQGNITFAPYDTSAIIIYSKNRSYREVIQKINKDSDNLSAEMTLRALSQFFHHKPATAAKGIILVDSLITLTGLNPKKYRIVDGSGVSHYNLISTSLVLEILKYIYFSNSDLHYILYNSLPIAGIDGTLKRRMKELPLYGNVHAKTGTLSGVSCLSGYHTAANGHLIAFSIFVQNYVGSSKNAVKFQDSICKFISEYN